jgi:hypothetical protein
MPGCGQMFGKVKGAEISALSGYIVVQIKYFQAVSLVVSKDYTIFKNMRQWLYIRF